MWTTAQIKTVGEPYCAEYTSADYNTTGQVWCSLKDKRGVMYFGSNTGLIVYDGNYWNTVQMDKEIPIMSLAMDTVSGKIYVGAMGDFGYLECNDLGSYEFKSIFDKIPEKKFKNLENSMNFPLFFTFLLTVTSVYVTIHSNKSRRPRAHPPAL